MSGLTPRQQAAFAAVSDPQAALDVIGRAAALRHWLTELCPECDGTGTVEDGPCGGRCDATGRFVRDGVTVTESKYGETAAINVPLDWLGDDQ